VVLHLNASHGPSSRYRLLGWLHDAHRQRSRGSGWRTARSSARGKDVYYLPGGKREPGETDVQTLVREIRDELDVAIAPDSASHVGTFEAQAHGYATGVTVRMTCYAADYSRMLAASSEIAELAWLRYADRDRVSPVDQIIRGRFP
jgi:8-oxo-dGTP diphosphatase